MKVLAVTNMYPSPQNPALGTFVEQQVKGLRDIGLCVDVLVLNRYSEGIGVYRHTAARVLEKLSAGGHDLVHVMYGGVMADLTTRAIRQVPSIVSFRGSDLQGAKLSSLLPRWSAHVGVLSSRRAARRAGGVITVSTHLMNALPADVDRQKVRVIPSGIDLERFRPRDVAECRRDLGWQEDAFHVLFSTNGNPIKRPELAAQAVARLKASGVNTELHELRGVPHEMVPVWINASDVLLMTSLHEGSPNIVKESLACNLPVVSVDVGDVSERIEGVDGCSILPDDPVRLAFGMYAVWESRRRSNNGRIMMRDLSLTRIAQRIKEFYEEVLSGAQRLEKAEAG